MATIDGIEFTITADASEAEKAIRKTGEALETLEKSAEKASHVKVDVKPTGVGELRKASTAVDGVRDSSKQAATALRDTSRAASGVKLSTQPAAEAIKLASASTRASGDVQRLNVAMRQAATARPVTSEHTSGVLGLGSAVKSVLPALQQLGPALTAASVAGMALTGGLNRLKAIDSAQAKLRGLGHDAASVGAIMNDALASVKGTAFGLGEAVSTAAGTVASGIKPGKELSQVLTTVADTAAIAGASMGEVGMIFNSVAARGKLQGDDMMQLLSRGIPVLQFLSKQLGVTSADVSDMVSKGQIDFATFEAAMREGMGGAAKAMGDSFEGAVKNTQAALGRLGAEVLTPVFKALPPLLDTVTDVADEAGSAVKKLASGFGALPPQLQALGVAVAAAIAIQKAYGTQLETSGTRLKTWGASVQATSAQLTAANTSLGAHRAAMLGVIENTPALKRLGDAYSGAAMQAMMAGSAAGKTGPQLAAMGRNAGLAAVGATALKGAASGLWAALGGPLGLAITGATLALGAWIKHVQSSKQAQQEAAAATDAWAAAFTESNQAIDASIQKKAIARVQETEMQKAVDAGIATTAEMAKALLGEGKARDDLISHLNAEIEARESSTALQRASGQFSASKEKDEEISQLKAARDALLAEGEAYAAGAEKAREAAAAATEVGEASESAAAKVRTADDVVMSLAGRFDSSTAKANSFTDAIEKMSTMMQQEFNSAALTVDDYLIKWNQGLSDLSKVSGGIGAFDALTGQLDVTNAAAGDFQDKMMAIRDSMYDVVAATYNAAEAEKGSQAASIEAAEAGQQLVQAFRDKAQAAGISGEAVDALIERYHLMPDEIVTTLAVQGEQDAQRIFDLLSNTAREFDEKTMTLRLDPKTSAETLDTLRDMHLKVDRLKDGTWGVTADPTVAQTERTMEALAVKMGAIPADKQVRIDIEAQQVDFARILADAGIPNDGVLPPAKLPLVADTEASQRAIENLQLKARELEPGVLIIEDNAPDVMKRLQQAGAQTLSLPQGNIVINHPTEEIIAKLKALGVTTTTLPDGRVVIRENSAEAKRRINANLDHSTLNKVGNVSLNVVRRITDVFTGRHATGGRIGAHATGGTIPRNAGGNIIGGPGGYRLPTTGPGADRTDGFLGVNAGGIPLSWVDAGEWIIRRSRSEKFDNTLAAINSGSTGDILTALARELPRNATGGRAEDIIGTLRAWEGTPYVLGGFSTTATDCTGAVSLAANLADGRDPLSGRGATGNFAEFLASRGFEPGLGGPNDLNVGWYHNSGVDGHAAATIGGTNLESGGRTGGGLHIGGPATGADDPQFTQHMHRKLEYKGDGGVSFDGGSSSYMSSGGSFTPGLDGGGYVRTFTPIETNESGGIGSTLGASFNIPGFAGNRNDITLGQRFGSEPWVQQARDAGLGDLVDKLSGLKMPEWDIFLKVNPDTIKAFNAVGKAQDDHAEAAYKVEEAEKALTEARKGATKADLDHAEKIAEARKALERAQAPDKKGKVDKDKVDAAQKKLDKLLRDTPDKASSAAKKIEQAEHKLTKARADEARKLEELERAQLKFQRALDIAPFRAVADVIGRMSDGFKSLAEKLGELNSVYEWRAQVEEKQRQAAIAATQAQLQLQDAIKANAEASRNAANTQWESALAVEDAEYELHRTRVELSEDILDLGERLEDGEISRAEVTAAVAEKVAAVHAASANVEMARAQQDVKNAAASNAARVSALALQHQQFLTGLESVRLAQAIEELGRTAGETSLGGQPISATQKRIEGKSEIASGIMETLLGVGEALFSIGGAIASGGAATVPAIMGTLDGVQRTVKGVTKIASGSSKAKYNKDESEKEMAALDPRERAKIYAAESGVWIGALGGAAVGFAGGSAEDAAKTQEAIRELAALPLNIGINDAKAKAEAQKIIADKQTKELTKKQLEEQLRFNKQQAELNDEIIKQNEALNKKVDEAKKQFDIAQRNQRKASDRSRDTARTKERERRLERKHEESVAAQRASEQSRPVILSIGGAMTWDPNRAAQMKYRKVGGFGGLDSLTLAEQTASWGIDESPTGGRKAAGPRKILKYGAEESDAEKTARAIRNHGDRIDARLLAEAGLIGRGIGILEYGAPMDREAFKTLGLSLESHRSALSTLNASHRTSLSSLASQRARQTLALTSARELEQGNDLAAANLEVVSASNRLFADSIGIDGSILTALGVANVSLGAGSAAERTSAAHLGTMTGISRGTFSTMGAAVDSIRAGNRQAANGSSAEWKTVAGVGSLGTVAGASLALAGRQHGVMQGVSAGIGNVVTATGAGARATRQVGAQTSTAIKGVGREIDYMSGISYSHLQQARENVAKLSTLTSVQREAVAAQVTGVNAAANRAAATATYQIQVVKLLRYVAETMPAAGAANVPTIVSAIGTINGGGGKTKGGIIAGIIGGIGDILRGAARGLTDALRRF